MSPYAFERMFDVVWDFGSKCFMEIVGLVECEWCKRGANGAKMAIERLTYEIAIPCGMIKTFKYWVWMIWIVCFACFDLNAYLRYKLIESWLWC